MGKRVKFLASNFPYTNPYVRVGDLLITNKDVLVVTGRDRWNQFGLVTDGTENAQANWYIDGRGRRTVRTGLVTEVTLASDSK